MTFDVIIVARAVAAAWFTGVAVHAERVAVSVVADVVLNARAARTGDLMTREAVRTLAAVVAAEAVVAHAARRVFAFHQRAVTCRVHI